VTYIGRRTVIARSNRIVISTRRAHPTTMTCSMTSHRSTSIVVCRWRPNVPGTHCHLPDSFRRKLKPTPFQTSFPGSFLTAFFYARILQRLLPRQCFCNQYFYHRASACTALQSAIVLQQICPSVCPSNAGIVSKPMDILSHFFEALVGESFWFFNPNAVTKFQADSYPGALFNLRQKWPFISKTVRDIPMATMEHC